MSNRLITILSFVLFIILLANQTLYVVGETDKVVKLEFGKLVEANISPGLHFKVPLMHEIKKFDARIISLSSPPSRYSTVEKKYLMVDLYAKLRITDAAKYYTAASGDESTAANAIFRRINDELYKQFGGRTLREVVSGERDMLMTNITNKLNETIGSEFGVEVVDVRVKRIDLPDEVSGDVYNRMRSERDREARKHRSEGNELAEGIKANADRQRTVIEADAFRSAEKLRGEGDAKAAAIYAAAYSGDPEFYSFLRSLQAYRESFSSKSDFLLIDPDSAFFKYLDNPKGNR